MHDRAMRKLPHHHATEKRDRYERSLMVHITYPTAPPTIIIVYHHDLTGSFPAIVLVTGCLN